MRDGAQRASDRSDGTGSPDRQRRRIGGRRARILVALCVAAFTLGLIPPVAGATSIRVVIVVGPVESMTSTYIADARELAGQARAYGAAVTELYSPNATWSRVRSALSGANLLIYLGHGNGWPSPYAPFSGTTKDGLGLNASAGHGNYNLRYYGESYLIDYVRMAPHAVVILNHLCYSAGNSEPGQPDPTQMTARRRIDNFGAGFLRTGAQVVFAEPRGDPAYILADLFHSSKTMRQVFWDSPQATHTYSFTFASSRTVGRAAISDPYRPGRYYRSVIGNLDLTAATWR